MTDYTAIFEAGDSLVELFRGEMAPEPIAKAEQIGLCEPQNPEDFQLTVWIYNIEEVKDTGIRAGYIPDPENPNLERYSPTQIKLFALVSAHSKAPAAQKCADEYRIIGRAVQLVRDNPSIPRKYLRGTIREQQEPVLLEMTKLGTEEISRIWNNSQKTIKPSFGITISQIFIQSNRVREAASRVASARFDTNPMENARKRGE